MFSMPYLGAVSTHRLIILLAMTLALPACRDAPVPAEKPPRPVQAAVAEKRTVPLYFDEIGRAVPFQRVSVRAQVSGPVTAIHFTDGADVRVGQVLFDIDSRPFKAAVDAASARVEQAQAKLDFDVAQQQRNKRLRDRDVVSTADLDRTTSTEKVSAAALAVARAEVETARVSLEYATIQSPIMGRAGKRLVDVGNIVKANETILLEIQRQDPIYVEFVATEAQLHRIRYFIDKGSLAIEAVVPGQPKSRRTGKLDFLDSGVKQDAGTVLLRGVFDNQDRRFWPGQFLRVRLLLDTLHDAVLVPSEAVQTGMDQPYVFVITKDDLIEVRQVRTGQVQERQIVIADGLAPGERVVVSGQLGLSAGARVSVAENVPNSL